jgi:hypothetical protein
MGTCSVKIKKSEHQIIRDVKELNDLTKSNPFQKRVGFNIKFNYSYKYNKIFTQFVFLYNIV